jgi:hypothetical protein
MGGGWATDGHFAPETMKGSLFHGNPADADVMVASLEHETITFIVKLTQQERETPRYRRDHTIQDTDEIARVVIYNAAP